MFETKKIVLLGAGYGGILTAKRLAKKFKKSDHIEIAIIDKNSFHTMLTELHEVVAERVPEEAVKIDLKKIFAGRKVTVVLDEIQSIDYEEKMLMGNKQDYGYDYLILGTGSKPTYYGCTGAEDNSFPLWSYQDAINLKTHIKEMFRKASVEKNKAIRNQMLSFVVVGCGFTGIEMIGELAEWKTRLCKDFVIDEDDVHLYVVDLLPKVLPSFTERLIRKTEQRLRKKKVNVLTTTNITEVNKDHVCINGDQCIDSMTVIWAAGVESSNILKEGEIEKAARNRVVTNEFLQSVNREDVFVVGDNIHFIAEGETRPVPQMVENAEHSAKLVAHNLEAYIHGKPMKPYKPSFHGAMVSVGGRYAVTQVGTTKHQFAFAGFFAMLVKHFINVIYFIQVGGFNKVWTYAMHEFFHVPDNRSFVGGHFSKSSPNFWLVPIRIFLGYSWIIEGLEKLPQILEEPSKIFLIPQSVNAVSGASEVAAEYADALGVPEFIESIVEVGMELLFYNPDGTFTVLAPIFQGLMVFGEVAIGLALLGGLFTAPASIASVIMGLMIWSSGMAPVEMIWFICAGVATIGGSGSVFGLDYYVLPFLKKRWKKLKFVKKWYLFTD